MVTVHDAGEHGVKVHDPEVHRVKVHDLTIFGIMTAIHLGCSLWFSSSLDIVYLQRLQHTGHQAFLEAAYYFLSSRHGYKMTLVVTDNMDLCQGDAQ